MQWMTNVLTPPEASQVFRRNDPNDPRLGELISLDRAEYATAQIVIVGCPQDEGVRRNRGRPGAVQAPAAIRSCLGRLVTTGLESLHILDLGDITLDTSLEATHARQRAVVAQLVRDGKCVVMLGGGNDISFPDCAGLADVAGPPVAFNIDAHFDVRADLPCNSGTPYRQLIDQGLLVGSALCELGSQPFANAGIYRAYLESHGATIYWRDQIRRIGIEALIGQFLARHPDQAIFWGLDMDVVHVAEAPGVSAPNALGISGAELCAVARLAGCEPRTRVFEISELNPCYDIDDRTARLAAVTLWHFLEGAAQRL